MSEPARLFPMPDEIFVGPPMCADCGAVPVEQYRRSCAACVGARTLRDRSEGLRAAWSSVPTTMRGLHFGDLRSWVHDAAAVDAAKVAADTRRPLVTLLGDAGAGKTSLAVCILRVWFRVGAKAAATELERAQARGARFVVACDLLEAARAHPLGRGRAPALQAAYRASLLVLDELGRDDGEALFGLLHARHREGKPTIVTTGLDRARIGEIYGGGIARRLFDDAFVINVRKG